MITLKLGRQFTPKGDQVNLAVSQVGVRTDDAEGVFDSKL
jgi:hypothetical protein